MTSQTERAKAKLDTLSSSFEDLEALLEPLFAQSLPESTLALEPIKQAKLQTVLPYLVYDLIFIYLKLRGVDPKTHPVVSELDRVKEYFNKISHAENPPKKHVEIDKDAAQRFIKHAITQATYDKTTQERPPPLPTPSVRVQAKITSKMLERQLYEKALKEQDALGSEEDDLEVFDDLGEVEMGVKIESISPKLKRKAKGKVKDMSSIETDLLSENKNNKRRRPAVDPFAGYGDKDNTPPSDDVSARNVQNSTSSENRQKQDISQPEPKQTKKVKKAKKKSR